MSSSQQLLPSILDRLIDDLPEIGHEAPCSFNWRDMRQSVRRDLENLLNARISWLERPESCKELEYSLLAYGLPDFSAMPLSSLGGRESLCRVIEETIRKFEPRFSDVAVTVVSEEQPLDRILRLRIHALLRAEPEPEEVYFDSEVEPVYLGIRVSES